MAFKKILNYHEEATRIRINETCSKYDARFCPKIRLADVLPIENSGISDALYNFALKSHFDFLITDNKNNQLFAVEFDGPSHQLHTEQKKRDKKKNMLCEYFNLPLLRINDKYLHKKYRNLDLLSWFLEVWFLREAFFKAQEQGLVPQNELFDPAMISELPERKAKFPLWLSGELRVEIQKRVKADAIRGLVQSELIGMDEQNNYYGFTWLRLDKHKGIMAQSAIRAQNFPILESEILSELLVFQLYEELCGVFNGDTAEVSIQDIMGKIETFKGKYKLCCQFHRSNP